MPAASQYTVPGFVRRVAALYAALAVTEGIAAPTIRFGRRHLTEHAAPPRIVIIPRRGPVNASTDMSKRLVAGYSIVLEAHIWGPEPVIGVDELENELLRWDSADPLLYRFMNVLAVVAPGFYEPLDLDPDADEGDPASVNEYGETYVYSFRLKRNVPRDEAVFKSNQVAAAFGGVEATTTDITTTTVPEDPT